jgi:hypothetical protein
MLNVANKPFILSVFMLNVIWLSFVILSVVMLNVVAPEILVYLTFYCCTFTIALG